MSAKSTLSFCVTQSLSQNYPALGIGRSETTTDLDIIGRDSNSNDLQRFGAYTPGETILIVMKLTSFETSSWGTPTVQFAVNPADLTTEPAWTNLSVGGAMDSAQTMGSVQLATITDNPGSAYGWNDDKYFMGYADEVRLGTTYEAVLPEATIPEPASALLLGLLGLFVSRRKRA